MSPIGLELPATATKRKDAPRFTIWSEIALAMVVFVAIIIYVKVDRYHQSIKDAAVLEHKAEVNTKNLQQYHAWCIYAKRWDVPMDKWVVLRDAGMLKP